MSPAAAFDRSAVRLGRARRRYFRENFAQGGVDLVQVIPELVTNADAAIAASGVLQAGLCWRWLRPTGSSWRCGGRGCARCALRRCCRGVTVAMRRRRQGRSALIDQRLGALGVEPPRAGQRGLFGRGLRDVWLAQGAGRIEGVRAGRAVESWFFPAPGDEPYAFVHVRDQLASAADLKALGVAASGTRVTVPLSAAELRRAGCVRWWASWCSCGRFSRIPRARSISSSPGRASAHLGPAPEPDPDRPVLFDAEVPVAANVAARIVVRRAKEPLSPGFSRATRRGGLVIALGARLTRPRWQASRRPAPGSCTARCSARRSSSCDALGQRPELVVKVDRSGLNEHHPIVARLYQAIDRVLRPIVAAEERRAAPPIGAPRLVTVRDQVSLRAR